MTDESDPAALCAECHRLEAENKRLRELYENAVINQGRFGFTINHLLECDEALRTVEALIPRNIEDAIALLPEDEQAEYRRCQQSVIDARRNANANEGQRWIG